MSCDGRIGMFSVVSCAALATVAACAQGDTVDLSSLAACGDYQSAGLSAGACLLEANGEVLQAEFAAPSDAGVVAIKVIDDTGRVRQVVMEENVEQHIAPYTHDIDGDGRADIVMPRARGNVNMVSALWLFADDGYYRRLGEINGYEFARTDDGLLGVRSRGSAAQYNIAYFGMGEGRLQLIASVDVELAEDGQRRSCVLADAPGLAALALTVEQGEAHFCGAGEANE